MPRLPYGVPLGPLLVAGLAVSVLGCSHRCPAGTTPRGKSPPRGRAQWCEAGPRASNALPAPGRSFESTLKMQFHTPKSFASRNLHGPMTTWFENGEVQSHGNYEPNQRGGSAPDGLWTVFYQSGEIRSQGEFRLGDAVGCFSFWDKDGNQYTATWSAKEEQFQGTDCEGPSGALPDTMPRTQRSSGASEPLGDIGFQTFFTSGGFGIENQQYLVKKPGISHNGEFYFRRYMNQWRFGGRLALRTSDDGDHNSVLGAATFGYALPQVHPLLDLEIAGALGLQIIEAAVFNPANPNQRPPAPLRFVEPNAAIETTASWRLHDYIALVATGRLEAGLPRTKTTRTSYCGTLGCRGVVEEVDWDTGGPAAGLVVGVRFLLR